MAPDRSWHIERVRAEATHPLRQRVLRPHQSQAEVGFAGDGDPGTGHFAALDAAGSVIGIVTVLHQPPTAPVVAATGAWWRLRGMATAAHCRTQGVGSALVTTAQAYAAAQGATGLWCHARVAAVPFYRKMGFAATGEVWDEPGLGGHVLMWKAVVPPP